jgi:hypothetical protein
MTCSSTGSATTISATSARRLWLGYEAAVLAGAQGLLARIAGIQVELSTVPLYEGQQLYGELLERLRGSGFELWGIAPGFFHPGHGRLLQFDGVFFREESELPAVGHSTGPVIG